MSQRFFFWTSRRAVQIHWPVANSGDVSRPLAEQGVTVIVTTHFMEEAEYCDHVVILDNGRVLARGTPAEIRRYAPVEEGA